MPEDYICFSLFSSAVLYSSISKVILFLSHHVFHTLNQNDELFLVLIFFAPFFRSSSLVSSVARVNLTWFNTAIFLTQENLFERFFKKFSHHFTWYDWLRTFSCCLPTNQNPKFRYVICTGITLFALVLYFLALSYTWTALLSANQNRVVFYVYY